MTSSTAIIKRGGRAAPWWRPMGTASRSGGLPEPAAFRARHLDSPAPFRALAAFTFVLFISPQSYFTVLEPLRLALVAALVAVSTYLFDRVGRGRPVLVFTSEIAFAGALLGWAVVTLPLSYWTGGSINTLLGMYIKTLVVFWLLGHVINTLPRLQTIVWMLSLLAVPLALTALANLLLGNYVQGGGRIIGYTAPLTGNPNDLALTLNIILPLSIGLFLATRRPGLRALLVACICVEVLAVFSTYSRAGFLTIMFVFALYLWGAIRQGRYQWVIPALLLGLTALVLMPPDYAGRLGTITDIESDPTGSAQARWRDTVAAVKFVFHHPLFGAGLGMDTLALNEMRGATWGEVHNIYLQYAVDLGIPGLILFVLLLRSSLKSTEEARHRARRYGADAFFHIATGIRVSLIAFAIGAFFHPVAYHLYFYYIAGLAMAVKMISRAEFEKSGSDPHTRSSAAAMMRRHNARSNEY